MKSRSVKVRAEVVLLLAVILVGAAGCSQLDGYDRSYSVAFTDGTREIRTGVTLRPNGRTPNVQRPTSNIQCDGKTLFPLPSGGFAK